MLLLQRAVLFGQPLFLHRQRQHKHRYCHNQRHDDKQRLIIHMSRHLARRGVQHCRQRQIQNAADRAHQVDDGIAAAAQGLRGHIRHQRHRRGAVHAHRNKQQRQHRDEQPQNQRRGRRGIGVVQHGQQVHQYDCRRCAANDVGHPAANARVRLIRQSAEERQQEQCQHIIRRHDRARNRLVQVESIRQNQRHHAVIHLPENADGQERQTDQHGTLGVELHGKFRPFIE